MSKRGIQYFTDGKKYVWAQLEGCAFDAINMLESMSSHQICFHSEAYMMPDKYRVRVECDERDTFDLEKGKQIAQVRILEKYNKDLGRIRSKIEQLAQELSVVNDRLTKCYLDRLSVQSERYDAVAESNQE